ncbi:MAG: zinc-binding dehydrogenase, partial [Pseudomonadota bacterium]
VVGSDDKVSHCTANLGYDAAVNRRSATLSEDLANACPNGSDVFFDNAGGPVYDEVLKTMNVGGRIVGCGRIAGVHLEDPSQDIGPRDTDVFIVKRLMKKGLLVGDYASLFPKALADLARWHGESRIPVHEDILDGLDNAPAGLMRLLSGDNVGKQLIRVKH